MATDPYLPLVQDRKPLNEVKYAARDFATIFDSLLRRLKVKYSDVYNDFATTTEGVMLFDLMGYAVQALQWYLDRTASDCFLATARTRAAVERLVEQIGYKMGPATTSSTGLKLTFPDGTDLPFNMAARWRYEGPNSLQFESYAEVISAALAPGATIDVDIRQGETRTLTYTADGEKNQTYRLSGIQADENYLAEGAVEVWVDGMEWEEKDFLEFEETDHFEVSYLADPSIVRFGDGIAGNIPPVGAEVKIRYIIIQGKESNCAADSIQTSLDTLYINGTAVTFTMTNAVGARGGNEPETINSAKTLAPVSFAARGAAITLPDYEALAASYTDATYGRVALSYAHNPRAALEDLVFNDLIAEVQALLDAFETLADGLLVDINTAADSADAIITQINTDIENLNTLVTRFTTNIGGAIGLNNSINGYAGIALASAAVAKDASTAALAQLDALRTSVNASSTIIQADKDSITAELNAMELNITTAEQQALSTVSSVGSIQSASQSASEALNLAYEDATDTSPVAPAFTLPSVAADLQVQSDAIDVLFTDPVTGLQAISAELVGAASQLNDDIDPLLASMHTRIGELFDDDCMSNYVQVPILGTDLDGNYVAPSVGLVKGLQARLEDIKEVTQDIEVVDGSPGLLGAIIDVQLEVLDAFVDAEVDSAVRSAIIGILKGRKFNKPLYLDTLYEVARASTTGIHHINIEITNADGVGDEEGNLIGRTNQVIVNGGLTIALSTAA